MKTTALTFSAATLLVTTCLPAAAQQTTGVPGSPSATTTIDGNYIPNPPPAFGGEINLGAKNSKPWWPPNIVAAEGRAQRVADHDGRSGLRDFKHIRRRHSDADHGPHRENGIALHGVPFDRPLFTLTGGDHHRPQPSLRRLRGHRRTSHRLPGLQLDHRRRQRHNRHNPEAERLCHLVVRQGP